MAQIAIPNKYRNELGRAYRKMYDNDTRHHRDELAASNILRQGIAELESDRKTTCRPKTA